MTQPFQLYMIVTLRTVTLRTVTLMTVTIMTVTLMTKSEEIFTEVFAQKSNSGFTLSTNSMYLFRTKNYNKRDKKPLSLVCVHRCLITH